MVNTNVTLSLMEALESKKAHPELAPYAGGTDLMVQKRPNVNYLFINKIEELTRIEETENEIFVGAACTYKELLESNHIPEIVKRACGKVASPALRNLGTMGGNICNASPAGDTLPALYALDARVKLASLNELGEYKNRVLPIEEFITGVRKLDLREDELLEQIILPKEKYQVEYYEKVGARQSEAIAKLSFVGLCTIENEVINNIRMAFGSVGVTVIRNRDIEKLLLGKNPNEVQIKEIIDLYDAILHPIDDQRSTASYRKHTSLALLRDFLESLRH